MSRNPYEPPQVDSSNADSDSAWPRYGMTAERYEQVAQSDTEPLTEEEIANGWHFCRELDGLLENTHDLDFCHCLEGVD